ncbi:MAG TPA: polysaccharide deacetylase [Candidatus Acidoferrales bacterium]|nr:polysaccharide deacetylase [Candidatus Acidoferrales bacterium]
MDKKISVCLTFDFDAISLWLGGFRATSLSAISRGEFGRVGAGRLLAMLREFKLPSTWFIPGHSAETYPQIVEGLVADGHEIGNHGYLHSRPKSPEDEAAILDRGNEVIARMTGRRPVGYRSPGAGLSYNMVELLRTRGFLYDSSLMGDDFSPYYLRSGDQASTDGPYVFGASIDVVEIPFTWGLDDFPAFEYVTSRAGIQQGLSSPSAVYEIWAGDFDYLYDRLGEGVYTLTMHPQVIGRGHRLLMLEQLLRHMMSHRGVEFRTMSEVATSWKQSHPLEPRRSP